MLQYADLRYILFAFFNTMSYAFRNPVALFNPSAKVDQTAPIGAERPVVVVDPTRRAMTGGAGKFTRRHLIT